MTNTGQDCSCKTKILANTSTFIALYIAVRSLGSRFDRLQINIVIIVPAFESVWEHAIRDQTDFNAHVDYVHINPVKHGLVSRVKDWPYSTFHRYVKDGVLPVDWGGGIEHLISTH